MEVKCRRKNGDKKIRKDAFLGKSWKAVTCRPRKYIFRWPPRNTSVMLRHETCAQSLGHKGLDGSRSKDQLIFNFGRSTNCRCVVTSRVQPRLFRLGGNTSRLSFGGTLGGVQTQSTCGESKLLPLQDIVTFFFILLRLSRVLFFSCLRLLRFLPLIFCNLPYIFTYTCYIFFTRFLFLPPFFLSHFFITIFLRFFIFIVSFTISLFLRIPL